MKKYLFIFLLLIIAINIKSENFGNLLLADNNEFKFDVRKLTFGGGIGFGFGSGDDDYWGLNISPQIGYNFSNKINAGFGISYAYYKENYNVYFNNQVDKWKDSKSYFGMNLYGNYYPIQWVVFRIRPEIMRMWQTTERKSDGEKYSSEKFIPAVVIGAGVRLKPMMLTINYDVVQDRNTPYGKNIFFNVGFWF